MQFDVYNGDADGICSLLQLRLENPLTTERVTGVKRDIALLERVQASAGDHVTVLDISMAKNNAALQRLLQQGASVDYIDHHAPGDIPVHANLNATISEAPEVCTALLVNGRLRGARVEWAITGAFGDNLDEPARQVAAKKLRCSATRTEQLRELGICINYNGYGPSLADLHFHPDRLYAALYEAGDPIAFLDSEAFRQLAVGISRGCRGVCKRYRLRTKRRAFAVYQLPNAAWARRVSGVFSNELVRAHPSTGSRRVDRAR